MQQESLSDNALMQAVKEGDTSRIALLYERHNKMLYGFFYKLTRRKDISEDLVHDVFMKVLRNRMQFRGQGKFSSWLYRIARNEAADYHKRSQKYTNFSDYNSMHIITPIEDNENNKEARLSLLEQAIASLSHKKRELLVLSRMQGLKYREVAEIIGSNETAVRVRVFRILNELKEIINKSEKSLKHETERSL